MDCQLQFRPIKDDCHHTLMENRLEKVVDSLDLALRHIDVQSRLVLVFRSRCWIIARVLFIAGVGNVCIRGHRNCLILHRVDHAVLLSRLLQLLPALTVTLRIVRPRLAIFVRRSRALVTQSLATWRTIVALAAVDGFNGGTVGSIRSNLAGGRPLFILKRCRLSRALLRRSASHCRAIVDF